MTLAARVELTTENQQLVAASVSANTRRAYASHLRRLDQWLANRPLTDRLLSEYIAGLFGEGKSSATCAGVVASVKFACKLAGTDSPASMLTDRTLAGIRRRGKGRGRGQVAGLTWRATDKVVWRSIEQGTLGGLRDAALMSVMSDALLRVSEAASLQVSDIGYESDGTGRLTIRRSKTDQEGEGSMQFLGKDTVQRVVRWLAESGIESGALFRSVGKGGRLGGKALSTVSIRTLIRKHALASGLDGRYSGHSFRVGSAQSLVRHGGTLAETMQNGRWKSAAMVSHYARNELAGRNGTARLRYGM